MKKTSKNFQSIINISKCIYIIFVVSVISIGTTGSYFSDTVVISGNQFSTVTWSNIVINEVYYDTDCLTFGNGGGKKTEEEGKNEWIELYNKSDADVNLKGWTIGNSVTEFTINPASAIIPAHGFLLLSHDNDTWKFWSVSGIETVNLGGSVNDGWLINTGDWVYLKDASNNIVDEMSFGDIKTAFDLSALGVSEGTSFERSPDGTDTNTSADFIKMTTPTPGS